MTRIILTATALTFLAITGSEARPDIPFRSDGCTIADQVAMFIPGGKRALKKWREHACIPHDKAYWQGGTWGYPGSDKWKADNEFLRRSVNVKKSGLAGLLLAVPARAVIAAGVPFWKWIGWRHAAWGGGYSNPFRWGAKEARASRGIRTTYTLPHERGAGTRGSRK